MSRVLCTRAGWAYSLSEVVPMNSSSQLCILLGVQLHENWDLEKNGQKGKCKIECWKRGILALEMLPTFFFFSFLESLLNFLIMLLLFFFKFLLIEGYLLYRILLFSVKPQHESAIRYTYVPSLLNLPPISHPSHPSRLIHRPCLSSLRQTANFHRLSVLHMVI